MMALIAILVVLAGIALGSFLNAFVWRFLRQERITDRHSVCVHCHHALAARDLVPVVSFLLLKGRCRYCRRQIPWHYPVVELATGALLLVALLHFGIGWTFGVAAVFVLGLEALFLLDLRYSILPDAITLPSVVPALALALLLHRSWEEALIGGILGAGVFFAQHALSRGTWIGEGDIRLGGVMGIALGWKLVLVALFLAYIAGALVGIVLLLRRKTGLRSHIPFGVFLTAATYVTLLWGDAILAAYLSIIMVP